MNKNSKLLKSFTAYCTKNKDERFWQALRNWSGATKIYYSDSGMHIDGDDTFFWEDKDK